MCYLKMMFLFIVHTDESHISHMIHLLCLQSQPPAPALGKNDGEDIGEDIDQCVSYPTSKFLVYMCGNATKLDNSCRYTLCADCWGKKTSHASGRQSRSRRSNAGMRGCVDVGGCDHRPESLKPFDDGRYFTVEYRQKHWEEVKEAGMPAFSYDICGCPFEGKAFNLPLDCDDCDKHIHWPAPTSK